jgi:hypothetical protein
MIGSVTEYQNQMREIQARREAAKAQAAVPAATGAAAPAPSGVTVTASPGQASPAVVTKAGKLPGVPRPAPEHISWAKRVLSEGWQAPVADRTDALRILDAAGVDPAPYRAGREPDTAPPGARAVAEAHRARERAEADAAEQDYRAGRRTGKAFADRGAAEGPGEPLMPASIDPEDFRRGYISEGHGAPAPMAGPARSFPVTTSRPAAQDFGDDAPAVPEGRAAGPEDALVMHHPAEHHDSRPQAAPGVSGPVPRTAKGLTPAEMPATPLVTGSFGPLVRGLAQHQARVTMRPPIPDGEAR